MQSRSCRLCLSVPHELHSHPLVPSRYASRERGIIYPYSLPLLHGTTCTLQSISSLYSKCRESRETRRTKPPPDLRRRRCVQRAEDAGAGAAATTSFEDAKLALAGHAGSSAGRVGEEDFSSNGIPEPDFAAGVARVERTEVESEGGDFGGR